MSELSTWRLAWRRTGRVEVGEHCTVQTRRVGLAMRGAVVGAEDGIAVLLEYSVRTDAAGFTTVVRVSDLSGDEGRSAILARSAFGSWTMDGGPAPSLDGCTDIDLGFSPSTNALPIRRLGLQVSQSRTIHVAWLRYPQLTVERVVQTYTRLDATTYRYASRGFEADLTVDVDGFVVDYAEWRRAAIVRSAVRRPDVLQTSR